MRRRAVPLWYPFVIAGVLAQAATARGQEFDVQNFRLTSPGDGELFAVQSARLAPQGQLAMYVLFGYQANELIAVDGDDTIAEIVGSRLGAELAAAYGFGGLELSAAMPFILTTDGEADPGTGITPAEGGGTGDLRLQLRGRLLGGKTGLGLSAGVLVSVPTATGADFGGDETASVTPRLALEVRGERLTFAVNLGARVRESKELAMGQLEVGSSFAYGAGVSFAVAKPFQLIGELEGETAGGKSEESPLEGRAGARYRFGSGLSLTGGYGRGIVYGYGAPEHRVFLAFAWRPDEKPAPAMVAPPPEEVPPEPTAPPPNPDPDGDGIVGDADACPDVAEDFDGFEDTDGCPEDDNDKDEIKDVSDGCPVNAEDKDGYADEDGCPEPDNDFDGIADALDKCPNEAEIINGVEDNDGCPDEGKQLVVVTKEKIEIKEKLYFATGKDVILPKSEPVLSQLALTLQRSPWIKKVRIEGHTDSQGNDANNLDLSNRRAASVKKTLIERGIAPERLESVGYGETQPIDSNKTVDGRANNRRTEFVITEQDEKGVVPAEPAAPAGAEPPKKEDVK